MKKIILGLFLIGLAIQSYSQDVIFQAKIKKENVPTAIIEAVDYEFGDFEVDEYFAIPIEFIEEDVYINRNIESDKDYDTYQVTFKGKNGKMVATYNKKGKLLSTIEHLKNVAPNFEIQKAVVEYFPGWTITKDHYKMIHFSDKNKKERYKLNLEKGKEKMVVFLDGKGKILKPYIN